MSTNELHLQNDLYAEEEFARKLETIENTVIRPIVRRKLHVTLFQSDEAKRNQDALDLVSDIRLVLVDQIRKAGSANGGINSLSDYAARVAFNACYQHFRSRFPQRTRLRNKLRYLFTHDAGLALWRDSAGRWLCGNLTWQGSEDHVSPAEPDEDVRLVVESDRRGGSEPIYAYLEQCGGPVLFDDIVNRIGALCGLIEPTESSEWLDQSPHELSDPKLRIDAILELTSRLRSMWADVLELSLEHRTALLLNLREPGGENLLAALPLTGVAPIRKIAAALEIPFEEMAEIWNSLPWDDNRIAEHLGVTRQQIINLRQTARTKLRRKLNNKGNI